VTTHEGIIGTLKGDGRAEVVIQPVNAGIPGASTRVNRHACHCATDGSFITIEALNGVGAEVGDLVSVRRDASALAKNAAALLGIPMAGLLTGIILAVFLTHGFSWRIAGGMIVMALCLLCGVAIGVLTFRRVSVGSIPVIEEIIEKRWKGPLLSEGAPFCPAESTKGCKACTRPLA